MSTAKAHGARRLIGEILEAVRIVLFATAAAIVYGVLHDLVTAHLCVEYFTIAHPPVFATNSPLLLALGWGLLATWWVGLALGVGLATAARIGPAPKIGLPQLAWPILVVMVVSGVAALLSGIAGASLAAAGIATVPDEWATLIPPDKHVTFSADAWAHAASYAAGAGGGLFLIGRTVRRRLSSNR